MALGRGDGNFSFCSGRWEMAERWEGRVCTPLPGQGETSSGRLHFPDPTPQPHGRPDQRKGGGVPPSKNGKRRPRQSERGSGSSQPGDESPHETTPEGNDRVPTGQLESQEQHQPGEVQGHQQTPAVRILTVAQDRPPDKHSLNSLGLLLWPPTLIVKPGSGYIKPQGLR